MHINLWSQNLNENKPDEIPSHRREDNIKMDPEGIGYDGVDSIHIAQDKVPTLVFVKTDMGPSGSIRSREFIVQLPSVSFSYATELDISSF
jgi:hypothetical protein